MVQEADPVLTAEAAHRTILLGDHPGAFRKVLTLGQLAEAATAGERASGRELLALIGERGGSVDPRLDVPDPYGRGPEAARVAADLLTGRLRAVLTALGSYK